MNKNHDVRKQFKSHDVRKQFNNRQLRKVTKTKSVFPTHQAVRKLLYLVNINIAKKWTRPIVDWPLILNQLAIRFGDRFPL